MKRSTHFCRKGLPATAMLDAVGYIDARDFGSAQPTFINLVRNMSKGFCS